MSVERCQHTQFVKQTMDADDSLIVTTSTDLMLKVTSTKTGLVTEQEYTEDDHPFTCDVSPDNSTLVVAFGTVLSWRIRPASSSVVCS